MDEKNPDKPVRIELYPDTGHHYVFIPRRPDVDLPDKLLETCDFDNHPWQIFQGVVNGRHDEVKKFVRWRLGYRETKPGWQRDYGIWCAIDTNTGDSSRGSVLERIPCAPKKVGSPADVPYFSHDPRNRENLKLEFPWKEKNFFFLPLEIVWPRDLGEPFKVDLVIDFGNSRTAAVLIETPEQQQPDRVPNLSDILRPVVFPPRCSEPDSSIYNSTGFSRDISERMVVGSWFVLQEPIFADFEPPRIKPENTIREDVVELRTMGFRRERCIVAEVYRIPQMFVDMSPVVMGTEALNRLSLFDFSGDGCISLSSPKRYAWDHSPQTNPYWVMFPNRWSDRGEREHGSAPNTPLAASVLRFMPEHSSPQDNIPEDWPIESPPNENSDPTTRPFANPERPCYCRADTIIWAGLAVIEMARRQFCSMAYRKGNAPYAQRWLNSVTVTFPPGWTETDKAAYRREWQTALNIFCLTHLRNPTLPEERPALHMDVDEAFASQLPIVYGEIIRMGGVGENWIELVGRGTGKEARVRVLSIDVGGGSTDYSIIEYRDELPGANVHLSTTLLFKDSSSIAGDVLLKNVIEQVLLPGLGIALGSEKRPAFDRLFNGPRTGTVAKEEWKRIARCLLIPKAIQMLSGLITQPDEPINHNLDAKNPPSPLWESGPLEKLKEFAAAVGLGDWELDAQSPVTYKIEDLRRCIRQTFVNVFDSLAKFVTLFEVDLVIASGKPTELPDVRQLLEEAMPLFGNRIIHTKSYMIGSWYPFRDSENRIFDAKTVTVVGAALYRALRAGVDKRWSIRLQEGRFRARKNIWVLQHEETSAQTIYLDRGQDENEVQIQVGTRIGRKILRSQKPEPVYILAWTDPGRGLGNNPITVTLRRAYHANAPKEEPLPDAGDAKCEHLEIEDASGIVYDLEGTEVEIGPNDVKLTRCTLESASFWMDDPDFQVVWDMFEERSMP